MESEVFSDNRLLTGHNFHSLGPYFQWTTLEPFHQLRVLTLLRGQLSFP